MVLSWVVPLSCHTIKTQNRGAVRPLTNPQLHRQLSLHHQRKREQLSWEGEPLSTGNQIQVGEVTRAEHIQN
jgi:hypothetical protein